MKIKKEELLEVFYSIQDCTYSPSTSTLALFYIKLKECVEKLEKNRIELAEHLGKEKYQEYLNTIQKNLSGNTEKMSEDCLKFAKDFNEAIIKLLNEEIDIEVPELDIKILLDENKFKAKEAAILYKIFK